MALTSNPANAAGNGPAEARQATTMLGDQRMAEVDDYRHERVDHDVRAA